MFVKPRYVQVLAIFLGLAAAFTIGVAPPDLWYSAINPLGSGAHRLIKARFFYLGSSDVEGQVPDEMLAWRTLAKAAKAESIFRQVFIRGTSSARVYALLGLERTNPEQYRRLVVRLQGDTSVIDFWTPCKHGYSVPLERIVSDSLMPKWLYLIQYWDLRSKPDSTTCAV